MPWCRVGYILRTKIKIVNAKIRHATCLLAFTLLTLSAFSQDPRYKQFGPLFDGDDNSYEKHIKEGWIYLSDARIPSEGLAVEWSSLL